MWYGNYSKSSHYLNDCSIIDPVNIDIADLMSMDKCGQSNEGSTSDHHSSNLFEMEEGKLLQRRYLSTSRSYSSFIEGLTTVEKKLDNCFIISSPTELPWHAGSIQERTFSTLFLTGTCFKYIELHFHKLVWRTIKTPSLKGRLPYMQ